MRCSSCSTQGAAWAAADRMRTELVLDALHMALGRQRLDDGLLHHSDRGSQWASGDYRRELDQRGVICSMSRKANCRDNVVAESFFATIKKELIHRRVWTTRASARNAIADHVEMFYNPHRRHSALGYISPAEFERCYHNGVTTILAA